MDKPLVSVIIPCYNYGKYVGDAIDSVKMQSYENWECVVVNDGSTDDSETRILDAINGDERFTYLKEENKGASSARNAGICKSKGKYIVSLDADDVIFSDYLKNGVRYMEEHGECVVYYGRVYFWYSENTPQTLKRWLLTPTLDYKDMLKKNYIYVTSMIRRKDYDRIGGYDEKLNGYEDWEFYIRLLYRHFHLFVDNHTDALLYRQHGKSLNNLSLKNSKDIIRYVRQKNKKIYMEYGVNNC